MIRAMTNQPEPVPPATPPAGQLPPGLSPNGHPTPTAQLMQQLPQMLAQAMAAILGQIPVTVKQLFCATCVLERLKWGSAHAAEMTRAEEAFRAAAAAMEARAPQDRVPVDPAAFIPPHLQGGPQVSEGAVMVGGTLYCLAHTPGAGAAAGGRKEFLIANAPLSAALIAEVMGQAAA